MLRALAIAHDDHARAAMLHLETGPAEAISSNAWPHCTIAAGAPPYAPVYSNCLWERASAASNLEVTRDAAGKPLALALPSGGRVWRGELPAGKCVESSTFYPPTNATIELLPEGANASQRLTFNATLCADSLWNRTASRCVP